MTLGMFKEPLFGVLTVAVIGAFVRLCLNVVDADDLREEENRKAAPRTPLTH